MKKTTLFSMMILIVFATSVFAEKIMNNNVSVRTMPGAFYPIVTVLNAGTEVTVFGDTGPWKKVRIAGNQVGWVSANAFNAVENTIDYGAMAVENPERSISKIMVTAAVKGFFENKMKDKRLNRDVLVNPYNRYLLPDEYIRFKTKTYQDRWQPEKFARKNPIRQQGAFKIDEHLVALSSYICARLTAQGLSRDQALVSYVNNVAQLIMENTEFYDLPICVHVVKTDNIFANATPIGVIVMSEGILGIIRNESELACLLGHEIAHVTLHHGAAEYGKRRPNFKAEAAFEELGEELGMDEDEQELDELSNEMYERAVRGRKFEYELAADERGMIYARRAGYKANGMISLLESLKVRIPVSRNPEDTSHWLPRDLDKRVNVLKHKMAEQLKDDRHYADFQERYRYYRH